MAKYFLLAGEASGDMHASALIKQIQHRQPDAAFAGLGGDKMAEAGCHLYQHIRNMAFMGFAAVLKNMGKVRRNFRIAKEALLAEQPDVLILVDYPSFNLRIASFCRKHLPATRIIYYIPPKVWAWKRRRIHRIAKLCDEVLGIFPFEPDFYARYGYRCTYVGNPTKESIDSFQIPNQKSQIKNLKSPYLQIVLYKSKEISNLKSIALLPGSRPSEIAHCLPKMLEAARRFPEYTITICAAPGIEDDFYTPYISAHDTLTRDTYTCVREAAAAIVNSGTATLETALLGCPQVAVYHLACAPLIGLIRPLQPLFVSIRYFTLVNILAGKEVIRECIANEFTVDKVAQELNLLLHDEVHQKEMLASYEHLSSLLGSHSASVEAARIITAKP